MGKRKFLNTKLLALDRARRRKWALRKVKELKVKGTSCKNPVSSFHVEPFAIESEISSVSDMSVSDMSVSDMSIFSDDRGSDFSDDLSDIESVGNEMSISNSEDSLKLKCKSQLANWALNVPKVHVNSILKLLRTFPCHSDLPTDYRSLLMTPRVVTTVDMFPGKYVHVGLVIGIEKLL